MPRGPAGFYPASQFKLHRRKPLRLSTRAGGEEDLHCSSNYFNPAWSGSGFQMPSTVPDDSAPFAPLASLEAESRPQQPQAAPHQLGSRRSFVESGGKGGSK